MPLLFFLLLLTLAHALAPRSARSAEAPPSIVIDDFEQGLTDRWEHKCFKAETLYRVVRDNGGTTENKVLKASTEGGASGLIHQLKLDLDTYPIVSWRWKVEGVLPKGDATNKSGDDYPARIYIVFPGWMPFATTSINYIWANKLPKGQHIPSTFN